MSRRDELANGLQAVRERIQQASAAAGRDPAEITLIAVTKFFPASDIDVLHELGVTAIGESRDQEAALKLAQVACRAALEVHFVGQLQSKKAGSVVGYADVVQSVDRPRLVEVLARAAQRRGRALKVLVQVSLEAQAAAGRGGAAPREVLALADEVQASDGLELRGVMALAPLGADPAPAFARLREVAHGIRERHPAATWVSAGMSADLEAGIAAGATHLRVGSAILGSRPRLDNFGPDR